MRILGIDPGLRLTGYACIECDGPRRVAIVEAGVVRLTPGESIPRRLCELDADLSEMVMRLRPEAAFIEKLFAHYARPMTAVVMGHARGVAMLSIARAGVACHELGATEVKRALTGNGHAGKAQMQDAVRAQLGLRETPRPADVADALAIALGGAWRLQTSVL